MRCTGVLVFNSSSQNVKTGFISQIIYLLYTGAVSISLAWRTWGCPWYFFRLIARNNNRATQTLPWGGWKPDNIVGGLIFFQTIQKAVRHQAKQEKGKEMSIPTADFRGQGEELLKNINCFILWYKQYHNQRVLFNSESKEILLRSWRKDPQAEEWISEFP